MCNNGTRKDDSFYSNETNKTACKPTIHQSSRNVWPYRTTQHTTHISTNDFNRSRLLMKRGNKQTCYVLLTITLYTLYYITGTLIYNVLRTGQSMSLDTRVCLSFSTEFHASRVRSQSHSTIRLVHSVCGARSGSLLVVCSSRADLFGVVCRRDSKYILLHPLFSCDKVSVLKFMHWT
jgi:hypothetical protein